jgi:hypothetical protein
LIGERDGVIRIQHAGRERDQRAQHGHVREREDERD